MKPWIIIADSPVAGFQVFGPWNSEEEALLWAELWAERLEDQEWWPMEVQPS